MAVRGSDRAPPSLEIHLFGPFEVRRNGSPLPRLRSRKGPCLLALLALRHGGAVERGWVAGTLWPDSPELPARANLRNSLTDLRQALGPEADRLRSPTAHTLCLDLAGAAVDVVTFDQATRDGNASALETVVALYRGPLLEGWSEEWVFQERQSREQSYLTALETLAARALASGESAAAERHLRRALAVDPLRETAQRGLMQAMATGGNYAAALLVYRELRLLLHREMNAEPGPETEGLYRQIRSELQRRLAEPPRTSVAASGRAASATRPEPLSRLPRPLTRLIGRQQEVREIRARLASERLVTLTGPGGVGKTRLAIQVAGEIGDEYADGAAFVDLARLADPRLVPQAVAVSLDVREQADLPLTATLQAFLRGRQLLLVLDNCEHLLLACAELAESLLGACPGVTILASSREGLNIPGETVWRVPSLAHPDPIRLPPLAELAGYDAVQLFVDRAAAALSSFALTEQNAPAVAQVCHRLDGIPLCLELAAARVKALPVEAINERLDDMFRLLTGGSRTALPRQQTLRALIDWSYALLSEAERVLLRRLSVFAGGWNLEAAEAVATGDPLKAWDVLDLHTALVEKSLAVYEEREAVGRAGYPPQGGGGVGPGRYRLLESVRQYGREKLLEAGEFDGSWQRHLDHYLSLAEEAEPHLHIGHAGWQKRLEREHDNLRAALEWSLTSEGGAEAALRLVGSLTRFWLMGSHGREANEWAARALARGRTAPPLVLARALESSAAFAFWQGDCAAAAEVAAEGLHFARKARDHWQIAYALFRVALTAVHHSDFETARASTEEGIALARAKGDRWLISRHLVIHGLSAWMRQDYAAARRFFQESLELSRALEDEWHTGMALALLGPVTRRSGDREAARALHQEGLPLFERLGDRRGIAWHLVGMAGVEVEQGRADRSARLLGAAAAVLKAVGSPLPPFLQRERDQTRAETVASLEDDAFAAGWAEGEAMTLEDAIRFTLEGAPSPGEGTHQAMREF